MKTYTTVLALATRKTQKLYAGPNIMHARDAAHAADGTVNAYAMGIFIDGVLMWMRRQWRGNWYHVQVPDEVDTHLEDADVWAGDLCDDEWVPEEEIKTPPPPCACGCAEDSVELRCSGCGWRGYDNHVCPDCGDDTIPT